MGDEETQARLLADLAGETSAQGDMEETPTTGVGETPIPHLAADVAEKQAEADRQAKEAAELAADEQEARREAEEQKAAVKEAKLAAARAPGAGQPEAQTNADEIDRQARLAAEEAAAKGDTAKEAADRAVEKGADAGKAKQNLFVVGKTAGQPPAISGAADGVVGVGTELVVHGNFSINPGSSVTFEDADGTRGTATDGINAKIVKGSIDTTLTGPVDNVTGGDGQLSTEGLRLVDTTGIAPDSGRAAPSSDVTGAGGLQYAPNTGAGGLQYTTPGLGGAGSQSKPVTAGQPGGPQATSSAPATSGSAVLAEGLKYLGQPYVHGGAAPGGFDCSGFTQWVYGAALGVALPDSPAAQYAMGTPVPVGTPGALIFFSEDGSGVPTHVGLDMGDGTVLHASIFTGKVSITPINYITGLLGDRKP
jgi:cell wall-associated NlpC family hydrolase